MSGDLTMRKRALTPIKSLIYGLRRYDLERSAAVQGGGKVAIGYMSTKTKIYLTDIYDHIDFILASLDMYSAMTENLIQFSFNVSQSLVRYNGSKEGRFTTLASRCHLTPSMTSCANLP
jgi:Mg2+ and Co2+ transporter CorA